MFGVSLTFVAFHGGVDGRGEVDALEQGYVGPKIVDMSSYPDFVNEMLRT